ncbi:LCP family protein [Streptomyces sp. NPDC048392]|uniref:LCP family protein n=1 Tax=Streptomyces sp. NPDC048392 TaxID=3365543 RepID=UPI003718A6B6
MDAQGRGQAEDIDPADQWVLNPDTGDYELRLSPSVPQPPVPGQRRATPAPAPEREVPAPRRRRATPGEPPPERRDRRRPAKRKPKGKRILLWTGGTMAFVILAAGTAGYLYLQHLNDNIESLPDDGASTGGFQKDKAINILLIGTDKRTGDGNGGYGDKGSAGHADTTILLHVSKDRSNATALSIPRDLIVDVPDCPTTREDGTTEVIPGSTTVRFNTSLGQSGRTPSCTMRTVTELTGVTPDNFMVADFNAVKTLTSAVGGVEVCLAKDINDPDSHLDLPAGKHTVEGEDALAFVRTRHSVGFGGDLSRIELQQQFLSSLMRKLKSNDTLTSPSKMVKLAEAGTRALTVDAKLDSIGKLKDLGLELGKLNTKNLTFATVPVKDNPAEETPVTVVLKEGPAQQVFDMVGNDVSFTEVKQKEKEKQKKEAAAVAARLEGEKSEPGEIRVRVMNGGAPAGSAQQELAYLQTEAGVAKSENAGNAPAQTARTTLEYAPDQADQARALAAILGLSGAAMKPGESVTNSQGLPTMTLTLGKDFKGAGVRLDATSGKAPADTQETTADKVECAK